MDEVDVDAVDLGRELRERVDLRLEAAPGVSGVLAASARHLNTTKDRPHALISEKIPGWSPAELVAIWSDAALLAASEGRDCINVEDFFDDYERLVTQREVKAATRRDDQEQGP